MNHLMASCSMRQWSWDEDSEGTQNMKLVALGWEVTSPVMSGMVCLDLLSISFFLPGAMFSFFQLRSLCFVLFLVSSPFFCIICIIVNSLPSISVWSYDSVQHSLALWWPHLSQPKHLFDRLWQSVLSHGFSLVNLNPGLALYNVSKAWGKEPVWPQRLTENSVYMLPSGMVCLNSRGSGPTLHCTWWLSY